MAFLAGPFFDGDFALFFDGDFTLFGAAFFGAAAFFTAGFGAAALFPGDVLVEVLETFAAGFGAAFFFAAGLEAAFGFAGVTFGFTVATGFVLAAAAAFGFAAAFGLGFAAAGLALVFGLGLAAADLGLAAALGAAFGFGLGLADVAAFFLAGAAGFFLGAEEVAEGILNEPLTFPSFPAATSFFKWKRRSFLKFGGRFFCFSSMNFVIAYWLEPFFSFSDTIASLIIYRTTKPDPNQNQIINIQKTRETELIEAIRFTSSYGGCAAGFRAFFGADGFFALGSFSALPVFAAGASSVGSSGAASATGSSGTMGSTSVDIRERESLGR